MSAVYVHEAPCPRCRGELVFHACEPCAAPFVHCPACQASAKRPACARCRAPAARPATLEDLEAAGELAHARERGVEVVRNDAYTAIEGEVGSALWTCYAMFVGAWAMFALEAGADLRLRAWAWVPTVGFVLATGWPAWRLVARDRWFWAQALGAGLAATIGVAFGIWAGENFAEGPSRNFRWWAYFTLLAAWTAAYARRPDLVPNWAKVLVLRVREGTKKG